MASIEFFRNETQRAPITAEPVVWVSAEERRAQLWAIAHEQILGDGPVVGPQPTGGACNAQSSDEIADRVSAQDEANTHLRRKTRQKRHEAEQTGDEALRANAEQKIIRLGVRDRVVDPSQGLVATMITAQKGVEEGRTRVTGKGKSRGGSTGGLLHPGSLIAQPLDQPGKLGASNRVVLRAQGEHNVGSRIIA
jgi:hypothetical protein